MGDFPGGPVVKNPVSSEGTWVRSLVRELRPHMLLDSEAHERQLLSPCAREPVLCY